jgi:NAD(P)-dependent dehydrogenase (short-subunit alcohol dehydrogenase family)
MNKSILITGANAGIGKDVARQLAMLDGTEKVYLGCRNMNKAKAAKKELESITGKNIFEIVKIDVSDLDSVRAAVESLDQPVDALVMNAGGTGGKNFNEVDKNGAMQQFSVNVLGHVVLAEELLKAGKLTKVALYAGSEAARGVKSFGMKRPTFGSHSVDEFATVIDGSFFGTNQDSMVPYGPIKYLAALWMTSLSREYTDVRFITMSPGGTTGTEVANTLSPIKKTMMTGMMKLMEILGRAHKLEVGAKRFVDGINDTSLKSGVFYGSKSGITGQIVDQGTLFNDFNDVVYQNNANESIHRFIN